MHYLAFSNKRNTVGFVYHIRDTYPELLTGRDLRGDRPADLASNKTLKSALQISSDFPFKLYRLILEKSRVFLFLNVISSYLLLGAFTGFPID